MKTVAQTIQGEASGPAAQFAVAAVIYNRTQDSRFPSDPTAVVNQPGQFSGGSSSTVPSATAQAYADAIANGTLSQYGNVGNAVNFASNIPGNAAASRYGLDQGGANIGGNYFSDNMGPPTASFVAPAYGGNNNVDPNSVAANQAPGTENIGSFGVDPAALTDPSGGFIPSASDTRLTGQQIDPSQFGDTGGAGGNVIGPDGQTITPQSGSGGQLVYNPQKPEQNVTIPPATSSLGIAGKIPDVANAISTGFGAFGENMVKKISDGVASLEAYAGRGLVMVLAIVLFLVAAWLMVPRETKTRIISTAGTAAKAAA